MITRRSLSRLSPREISRRNLVQGTMGAAGAVLGAGLWTPARAQNDLRRCGVPLPITHTRLAPSSIVVHGYFPGPIDGSAWPTDPEGTHPEGRDPSLITNFSGFVAQCDLNFSGTATDTTTGQTADYDFHTDTRFMMGEFIASDEQRHKGLFAFI
jgi:hypothetical protein